MASKVVLPSTVTLSFTLLICISQARIQNFTNETKYDESNIFLVDGIDEVKDVESIARSDTQGLIDSAKSAVKNSLNVVRSGGSKNKGVVVTCVEVLSDAIGNLDDTSKSVRARKIADENQQASAALTNVETCKYKSQGSASQALTRALDAARSSINKVLRNIK